MSGAESLDLPDDQPYEAEILAPSFGKPESSSQDDEHIDQVFLTYMLSEENQEFVLAQAERHQVKPMEIINSAIETYALWVKIVESGSTLHVIDKFNQSHPINDSDSTQPPAA